FVLLENSVVGFCADPLALGARAVSRARTQSTHNPASIVLGCADDLRDLPRRIPFPRSTFGDDVSAHGISAHLFSAGARGVGAVHCCKPHYGYNLLCRNAL